MPHSTITITEDEDGSLNLSVEFDPPYVEASPEYCHQAALRAVQLLATDLGDDNPEVRAVSRFPDSRAPSAGTAKSTTEPADEVTCP